MGLCIAAWFGIRGKGAMHVCFVNAQKFAGEYLLFKKPERVDILLNNLEDPKGDQEQTLSLYEIVH